MRILILRQSTYYRSRTAGPAASTSRISNSNTRSRPCCVRKSPVLPSCMPEWKTRPRAMLRPSPGSPAQSSVWTAPGTHPASGCTRNYPGRHRRPLCPLPGLAKELRTTDHPLRTSRLTSKKLFAKLVYCKDRTENVCLYEYPNPVQGGNCAAVACSRRRWLGPRTDRIQSRHALNGQA